MSPSNSGSASLGCLDEPLAVAGVGRWALRDGLLHLDRVAARLLRLRRTELSLREALRRWPADEAQRLQLALAGPQRRVSLRLLGPRGPVSWRGARRSRGCWQGVVVEDDGAASPLPATVVQTEARHAWFAGISHELRTPLNAVLGFTMLARADHSASAGRQYLAPIEQSSKLMLRVVNDLLDLASLEAGRLDIEPDQPLALPALVTRVCAQLEALRADAPVRIYGTVDPRCPAHLRGDAGRLEQVLLNLAANALKFTPQGDVVVAVKVRRLEADRVCLRLSVADTGVGIAADQLSRLGRSFERADAGRLGRAGGSGLGLALVGRLLELHGTQLRIASVSGGGTMVWFDIEWPVDLLAPAEALVGDAVLFTDDRRLAETVATQWRAQGRSLRPEQAASGPLRWIVDTALHDAADRCAQARREGRELVVVRTGAAEPVLQEAVPLSLLSAACFDRAEANPIGRDAALEHLRVLVVEDNLLSQRVLVDLLTYLGLQPRVAGDARSAREAAAVQRPDLVLMDIQLPDQSGFECAAELLRQAGDRPPALIFLSAHAGPQERAQAAAMGARACLGKPFDAAELKTWLRRVAQDVPGRVEPVPIVQPRPSDDLRGLFAGLWPDWRRQLAGAPDPAALRRAVHALRGGMAAMGERTVCDLARHIEESLAAGGHAPAEALHQLIAYGDALAATASNETPLPV